MSVREGFFDQNEFEVCKDVLPDYLRAFVTFAYRTGWRLEEVATLTWDRVDSRQGTIRLESAHTKNKRARLMYMDAEVKKVIQHQFATRHPGCPYVFHRVGGKIKNYYKSWRTACREVGLEGKIFHDFRRTAVRNMVRAGVPERVAMIISGHKTRSVFDRYNIVNEEDLKRAAELQEAYLEGQEASQTVTEIVTKAKVGAPGKAGQILYNPLKLQGEKSGGATRIRTGDRGFADLCLTTWRWRPRRGAYPTVGTGELSRNRGAHHRSLASMLAPVQALVVLLGGGGLVGDFQGPDDARVGLVEFGAPGARQDAQRAGHGAFGHDPHPDPVSTAEKE